MRSVTILLLMLGGCGGQAVDDIGDETSAVQLTLAAKFAPVVRLYPNEPNRPANVAWYLPKVHLRFSHTLCPDHQILADGTVTAANLSTQSHPTTNSLCIHTSTRYASNAKHPEYFLQPFDTATTYPGTGSSGWTTYMHAKASTLSPGGWDLQYWFFYPRDDGPLNFNHEGDWEHITVTVDSAQNFVSAWYAQHNSGVRYAKSQLTFVNTTHPVVYSATGTHASYPSAGAFNVTLGFTDHTADGGPTWTTSTNLVDTDTQSWIAYGGRWGEIGNSDLSSGPLTPSFQPSWNTY